MLFALPFSNDIGYIILLALVFAAIGVFMWLSIRQSQKELAKDEALRREAAIAAGEDPDADPDESWTPPEPEAFPARIVDMRAVVGNIGGHKRPKTGMSFLVTFLTDDGERVEYPVPEDLYVTLSLDQTGTLIILNGGFFDFGDGEEIEEQAHDENV